MLRKLFGVVPISHVVHLAGQAGVCHTLTNLSNTSLVFVSDLVSILEQLLKVKAVKKFVKMPGNKDVQFTHANITLTEEELGYHPTTSLHSGLKKFVHTQKQVVYNHYRVEGLKGQISPPGAGVPGDATFFSSGGDGPTPFRFNPRDAGTTVTVEEMLTIDLEPGWKKAQKIHSQQKEMNHRM
ncbi:hypothetical protein ZIOFF_050226 [Zingiber officinale]|uniref:Uncharacterized protein n=1 Tax=Zingiber officinale TaxID=94328 RepID=A0A8J5FJX6_ZINOF|nr:hypothetical protein ZIOFF_050226 [Zingiber officinale]